MVGEVAGVAVRSGTRWRRSRGTGCSRESLFLSSLTRTSFDDPLSFQDVECLGGCSQARQETPRGFGEMQMRGDVASPFHRRVQLVLQRLFALTQQRHPLT